MLPLLGVRRGWLSPSETAQSPLVRVLLSAGICFGGGVILTSCLTHMLPDVNEVSIRNLSVHMRIVVNGVAFALITDWLSPSNTTKLIHKLTNMKSTTLI